jgi:hypothetical protein
LSSTNKNGDLHQMTRIFDGCLYVHYGQAYVLSNAQEPAELSACFQGQTNGLCGAAISDILFLITGLHTGRVRLSVDVLDAPPPLDQTWEEVVEVPFVINGEGVSLYDWNGECVCEIPLSTGIYRVRYCVRDMDRGKDVDTILEEEEPVDFYHLAFWSADLLPDVIVKQTSEIAVYWHEYAKNL